MCIEDQQDEPAKRKLRKQLFETAIPSISRTTPDKAREYVAQLNATYSPNRSVPKPEMYRAYRHLSLAYERHGRNNEALQSQFQALEAIGARLSRSSEGKASRFSKDPQIMLQDAIISCFDIAHKHHLAGDRKHCRYAPSLSTSSFKVC